MGTPVCTSVTSSSIAVSISQLCDTHHALKAYDGVVLYPRTFLTLL